MNMNLFKNTDHYQKTKHNVENIEEKEHHGGNVTSQSLQKTMWQIFNYKQTSH
jgi:flavin reductase (DIM6/NTAB) family NADH-FMN oxidoreductase RutF